MNKSKKKIIMLSIFSESANTKVCIGKKGDLFFVHYKWKNLCDTRYSTEHLHTYPKLEDAKGEFEIRVNVLKKYDNISEEVHAQMTNKLRELSADVVA